MKFLTFYDTIKQKKGKVFTDESLTNQDRERDTNITKMLQTYGCIPVEKLKKAEEMYYGDIEKLQEYNTISSALKGRQELIDYYCKLPAMVRKKFGDNPEIFIERFKRHEFDNFIEYGILSDEMIETIKQSDEVRKNDERRKMIEEIKQNEQLYQEAMKELGRNGQAVE